MLQGQVPNPPPTPTVPPDLGQSIGEAIKGAVGGALQSAAAEVRAEQGRAIARRDAIQAQLNATTRRSEQRSLESQLAKANAEIDKLNEAAAKLETQTGKLTPVASKPTQTYTGTGSNPPFPPPDQVPTQMILGVVGMIFIGFPLSVAFARILWRRATHGSPTVQPAQMSADQAQRFDRLEHAIDAVAIEIERISENQRYLTKVLAEGGEKKLTS